MPTSSPHAIVCMQGRAQGAALPEDAHNGEEGTAVRPEAGRAPHHTSEDGRHFVDETAFAQG